MYYKNECSQIDGKATAANAEAVLRDYEFKRSLARRNQVLRSPVMDSMPHATDNAARERVIVNQLDAAEFVAECDAALAALKAQDAEQATIIQLLYFGPILTAQALMERLAMSNTAYYNAKQKALVAFAQLFPPRWGELLVFKEGGAKDAQRTHTNGA